MTAADRNYDVIVVGSGGGLVGAYVAASRGLETLVIEKTGLVGGTTAYSGAGLWFPGSAPIRRAGVDDDIETARSYLRDVVRDSSREAMQDAYLEAGAQLIDELEQNPLFQSFQHGPVPDYFGKRDGATPHGRTIFPPPISVEELGDVAPLLRRSIPEERWGEDEGTVLSGGRALIGRALKAFLETGHGELRVNTAFKTLIVEDGRVVGIEVESDGKVSQIRASGGVILAAGGFEKNQELRAKYLSVPLPEAWSNGAPENTGDALVAGITAGADTDLLDEAWFVPGVVQPDGRPVFHTGTRGGIFVNSQGERFLNETQPYDQTGHDLYRLQADSGVDHLPAHWIFDQKHLERDSFGHHADEPPRAEWFESGALRKADTLEELAALIDVPLDKLEATIERFNKFAEAGVDEDFHRGESVWDQMFTHVLGFGYLPSMNFIVPIGDEFPNAMLTPIAQGPFYVASVVLSDIGTKGGLKTDTHSRVLRPDGEPIPGLYASGNTMSAMSGRTYPGAGTPIGSSLAFSYLAALDIVGAAVGR